MDWLKKLGSIPADNLLNISIPREKIVKNIKNRFLRMTMECELDNIEDIVYHAIFRNQQSAGFSMELHIIEVELREPKYVRTIAEAFQKTIPYRQIIIFSSGEKYLVFHSHSPDESIKPYQFSEWVYEEELFVDFSLGTERPGDESIMQSEWKTWWDLDFQFSELFSNASSSEFICLRHLIDALKIREIQSGKDYVRTIISRLVDAGEIVYFGDSPFVTKAEADSLYREQNSYRIEGCIVDRRFSADRYFEWLSANDLTTCSDVRAIVKEAECLLLYEEQEMDDYTEKTSYCVEDEFIGDGMYLFSVKEDGQTVYSESDEEIDDPEDLPQYEEQKEDTFEDNNFGLYGYK